MDGLAALFHQHPLPAWGVLFLFIYGLSYSIRYIVDSRMKRRKGSDRGGDKGGGRP